MSFLTGIWKCSHYWQYGLAVVSCSIVRGQHKRMIFGHRTWKEFGVEVEEGTEMRSVKSVMEHTRKGDQIDKWERVQLWIYRWGDWFYKRCVCWQVTSADFEEWVWCGEKEGRGRWVGQQYFVYAEVLPDLCRGVHRAERLRNIYFQDSKYICIHIQSVQFPFNYLWYGAINDIILTKH